MIEVIIVLALFLLISVGVIGALSSSLGASKRGSDTIAATGYVKEVVEAVRSIRDRDWAEVTAGTYGLDTGAGYYELQGSGDTLGPNNNFTRTITIEDVNRSPGLQGDISDTGTNDPNTKKVTVDINWDLFAGQPRTVSEAFYVYNFSGGGQSWEQSSDGDFQAGDENSTDTGSVVLREANADWSGLQEYRILDLGGNGDRIESFYDKSQDILYVLSENTTGDELVAIDVSAVSEKDPTVIDGFDMGGVTPKDFVVKNGYAYVVSSSNSEEVRVIDLATMAQVNSIDLTGTADATAVAYSGNDLIVGRDANPNEEVFVYDISNPTGSITQQGFVEIGDDIHNIVTDDAYAYVGTNNGSNELAIVRISDQALVNQRNLGGFAPVEALNLVGTNLYIGRQNFGGGSDEFVLADVSDPEGTISLSSLLNLPFIVNDITIDNNEEYAFLATSDVNGELQVIDLSTFTNVQTGDMGTFVEAFSVEQFGGHVYLGSDDASNDLTVFHTGSSGWDATLIGSADASGPEDGFSIAIDGNYAYVGREGSNPRDEFFIYDMSTPSAPTEVGSFDVGANINGMVVSGDYAYLATDDNSRELDVIDISTKTSPTRAGSLDLSGNEDGYAVDIDGNTVYLGREYSFSGDPFHTIDVSTPSSPSLLGTLTGIPPFVEFIDVLADDDYVYGVNTLTWTNNDLFVIDVSNPASPTSPTTFEPTGNGDGTAIALQNDTLAFARESGFPNEVSLIDVSTPTSPSEDGTVEVGEDVNDVVFENDNNLLLATGENNAEFHRWDISNLANPDQTDTYNTGGDLNAIVFDGTNAHLASESNSQEYQIIGPSGAPIEYAAEGTFTSQAFDSSQAGTAWGSIEWTTSGSGTIEFRIRTADSEANLSDATWVGLDGTRDTTYDTSGQSITTDPGAVGTQWVQWKAYLTGNTSNSPLLDSITLFY